MSSPKSGKVCVVGGAGYIGSRLVPHLIERGYQVEVIDACWFGNHLPATVKVLEQDVLTVEESYWKDFETVVFLAGLSNDPMAEYSPALNALHNVAAPAHAAACAKRAGVKRFVYADSCSVYGNTAGAICTEDSPARSAYAYGISKLQGGLAVMSLADESFSVIALRQGTVSGASPRPRFDLIVNTMYKCAQVDGALTVRNPAIWRPILAISDAVKSFTAAIEAPAGRSGVFNVASGNVTVGEVAETVAKHFKETHNRSISVDVQNIPDGRDYRASADRARSELGIEFTGSVQSILKELDEAYGAGFDYMSDNNYNIVVFKKLQNDRLWPYGR